MDRAVTRRRLHGALGLAIVSLPSVIARAEPATPAATPTAGLRSGGRIDGPFPIGESFALAYAVPVEVGGDLRLVGEVENTGDAPAVPPAIVAQGLDERGYEYGDGFKLDAFGIAAAPGERVPVAGLRRGAWPPLAELGGFAFAGGEGGSTRPPDAATIAVEGIPAQGRVADAAGRQGLLRNTGPTGVAVKLRIAYYAAGGVALGVCAGLGAPKLPPGKAMPFEIADPPSCVAVREVTAGLGLGEDDDYAYRVFPVRVE